MRHAAGSLERAAHAAHQTPLPACFLLLLAPLLQVGMRKEVTAALQMCTIAILMSLIALQVGCTMGARCCS
jgi:hypothetical protein